MVPAISLVRFHFCWSCSVSILSLSKGESSGGNPFGKSLILRHDFFLLLLFLVFVDLLLFEFFFVISAAFPSVRVKTKKSCYSWKQMSMNCSKITIFSFFVLSCLFQSGERSCDYRWISASLFLVLYFDYQKKWIHYDCLMVWFFFFPPLPRKVLIAHLRLAWTWVKWEKGIAAWELLYLIEGWENLVFDQRGNFMKQNLPIVWQGCQMRSYLRFFQLLVIFWLLFFQPHHSYSLLLQKLATSTLAGSR